MRELVQVLESAARSVGRLIASSEAAQDWGHPSALAQMSVGALAAHIISGLGRTEAVLDEAPPDSGLVVGIAAYYGRNRIGSAEELETGIHLALRADAERRAEAGPQALASAFEDLVDRLVPRLDGAPPGRLVSVIQVPGAGAALGGYIKTRIVELVVHGDDLAASIGAQWDPPADAATATIEVLLDLARARSGDLEVIRVFARRERADLTDLHVF